MALLGIHTTLQQEFHCIWYYTVYPGRICDHKCNMVSSLSIKLCHQLKEAMQKLKATPPHQQKHKQTDHLQTCTHVFV